MTPDRRYVKFPTAFIEFICSAKFPEYQSKMLLMAVRSCHGYHEPDRAFDIVDLVRWLRWDRRSVYRAAGELLRRKIFCRDRMGKYRINNCPEEWLADTPKTSANPPVDNSKQLVLQSTEDYRQEHASLPLTAHLSTGLAAEFEEAKKQANSPPPQENLPATTAQILDATEFLKKSLKKIIKKKENSDPDPDVLKNESERKKKIAVYRQMVRSGNWSDDELLELTKRSSAAELEAILNSRRLMLTG